MLIQPDLFGGPEKEYRQRAARHTTIPDDPDIPGLGTPYFLLPKAMVDRIIASAANWLAKDQTIRIIGGHQEWNGRTGVIHRLCSSVNPDFCYVRLHRIGFEADDKIKIIELRFIEPI